MKFLTRAVGRMLTIAGGTLHKTELTIDTSKITTMTVFEGDRFPAQLLVKFHSCCKSETKRDEGEVRIYHENVEEIRRLRNQIQVANSAPIFPPRSSF